MGQRGPKPTPTAIQKRQGTYRADRRRGEPSPERAKPARPGWLSPGARKHWPRIARQLDALGVLAVTDQTALGLLCEALADYLAAREIVARGGPTGLLLATTSGNIIQHPAVGVMNRARDALVHLVREFGLTPAARTSVRVTGDAAPADPLLDMIAKRYGSPN